MIEAEGLQYQVAGGGPRLLENIGLSVARGERVGLVGPSGAGKTTLAYHLCGVHSLALGGCSSGSLRLDGRQAILGGQRGFGGMVLQNPESQIYCQKVEDEVALGLGPGAGPEALTEVLARTGLTDRRQQEVETLSLGWKQRVSIAGMLAMGPRVLVLDEPTNFLDAGAADQLFDLLGHLRDTATVVVDHDVDRLRGWADRLIQLEDGRVVRDAPAGAWEPSAPLVVRPPKGCAGQPLLAMDRIHFAFERQRPVLQEFSLTLREGEIVVLLGANGSGKSTLLRLAKGLLRPGSGAVRASSGQPLMAAVALMFQNPDECLFATTVVEECAFLPRNLGLCAAEARSRSLAVLDRLRLGALAERAPFTLSYGEKRRVSLASVLTGGARILCLDEPTVGLDRANLECLGELLRDHADLGGGVILATHDRAFAQAIATRTVDLGPGAAP